MPYIAFSLNNSEKISLQMGGCYLITSADLFLQTNIKSVDVIDLLACGCTRCFSSEGAELSSGPCQSDVASYN
jgi:hypothetical protein